MQWRCLVPFLLGPALVYAGGSVRPEIAVGFNAKTGELPDWSNLSPSLKWTTNKSFAEFDLEVSRCVSLLVCSLAFVPMLLFLESAPDLSTIVGESV